jgi:hypothetical protein
MYDQRITGTIDLSANDRLEEVRISRAEIDQVLFPPRADALSYVSITGTSIRGLSLPENAPLSRLWLTGNHISSIYDVRDYMKYYSDGDCVFEFYPQTSPYGRYPLLGTASSDSKTIAELFPDAGFARYIADCFGTDTDARLTAESLLQVERVTIPSDDYTIYSLEGIEYLPAMRDLHCLGNQLSGTLDLRGNKYITDCYLVGNSLSEIYFADGTDLKAAQFQLNFFQSGDDLHGLAEEDKGLGPQRSRPPDVPSSGGAYIYYNFPSVSSSYSSGFSSYNYSVRDRTYSYETPSYYINHYTGDLYTSQTYTWRTNPYTGSGSYYDSSWDW